MSKFIGNKQFYRSTLTVAVPIMVQNAVTNFVSLLDNVMVGQCGLEALSAVAIISQIIAVYNATVFGTTSGPGLFCAQFYGARDETRLRSAFRFKLALALLVCAGFVLALLLYRDPIITLYINDTGDGGDPVLMMQYARRYMAIMMCGMPAFAFSQSYASTLREVGQTRVPMAASCVALSLNLAGNWVLIFGKLGFPELGIIGAAIATVVARWVEMALVVAWSQLHSRQVLFSKQLLHRPPTVRGLYRKIGAKSVPLFINELLWSTAQAFLLQLFSLRGLSVVAAINIAYIFIGISDVVCYSMGGSIGIIVGQLLGAGKLEEAVDTDRKLIAFTMILSVGIMVIMAVCAPFFPRIYDVPADVQHLATRLILLCACILPITILPHAFYFTLRSGGKTFVTFLFDSGFSWVVNIPFIYLLAHFTAMPVTMLYLCSLSTSLVKCLIGWILMKRRVWVVNLAEKNAPA